jgi:hypothetical protein
MINDLTNSLLDKILENINTPENKQKFQTILIDPLISYTYNRIYPYLMFIIIIFILTFVLVITILIILLRKIIF